MRHPIRSLILAAACLLFAAPSMAEARQPYRGYPPPRRINPNVYVFPQVGYRPMYTLPQLSYGYFPTYYPPMTYYPSTYYGGYTYVPGVYRSWYTPWGSTYYYTNPTYYYWYNFR